MIRSDSIRSLKTPRIGIAGAGVFGRYHARKYAALDNVELAAIFDVNIEAATRLATELSRQSDIKIFSDLDDFCAAVDAVVVTTPAPTHATLVRHALERGCHVFVEKPLATNLDEARNLVELAQVKTRVLQVGHQERYVASALGLFDLPEMPREIMCRRCMPATGRGEEVSVVLDLMIHDLDLITQFAGKEAPIIKVEPSGRDRDGNAQRDADDGAYHHVEAHLVFRNPDFKAIAVADRHAETRERSLTLKFADGDCHLDFLERRVTNSTPFDLDGAFTQEAEKLALRDPLAMGANYFAAAISDPRFLRDPIIPIGAQALRPLEWALQIDQLAAVDPSINQSKTLRVNYE